MTPLVGASTKMNLTSTQLERYLTRLRSATAHLHGVDLFVLPSFPAIWIARQRLAGSNVSWGAQDVHPEDAGAYTGDVSAPMLTDLGCTYVECGHSERRRDHGETDQVVAFKVAQTLLHGMTPILCVGEPTREAERDSVAFVTAQVRAALAAVDPDLIARVVVAYEPVWAIGVGSVAADPLRVERVHAAIHRLLLDLGGGAGRGRVIYGGSVEPSTARSLLERPGVDGLFVGRSALDPDNLAAIANTAAEICTSRSLATAG